MRSIFHCGTVQQYGLIENMLAKRIIRGFVLLLLLLLVLSKAAFIYAQSEGNAEVVATVNGSPITRADLEMAIDEFLPRAFFHGAVTPEKREAFKPQALESLIKRELFYEAALAMGKKISNDAMDSELKKIRERYRSKKAFEKSLKEAGLTEESLRTALMRNLLISDFIDTEITGKSIVSEDELRKYYETHKPDFVRPEAFRIRHIAILITGAEQREKAKKQAEEVLEKAKKGEDFGSLASKYSMNDWRIKGGDIGLVHKGRLEPAIEDEVLKLHPGEISGIIESELGFYIFKLEEKIPSVQLSYEEVKEKLRRKIEDGRRKEIEESILKKLRDAAKIEIY